MEVKEDTVQAVLIADAYDKNLEPFIRETSSVSTVDIYAILQVT